MVMVMVQKIFSQYYCRVIPQAIDVVRPSLSDKYKAVKDNVANQLRNKSSGFNFKSYNKFYNLNLNIIFVKVVL